MPVEPGQSLLHYRLVEKIGEGGMGVVWKAVDTTLDRAVAIKILPDDFALDAERLTRFEREAKLLASLNHPGIAVAYGLHEARGQRFLAMELVGGESLAERLSRGRLAVDEALAIARQIAEALEAAHESGVIHRDLKPANIQLAPGDRVKILDFGLAKAFAPDATKSGASAALSPTVTSAGTVAGVILGTAAYMSPEQARGRPVDRRVDAWGFGCVLYEMLTGKRAFPGETVTDLLVSVIKEEPDYRALAAGTPRRIERLIARCLVKDPHDRLRDIGDARLEIQEALARPDDRTVHPAAAAQTRRPATRALGAALLGGALVASAMWWLATRGAATDPPGQATRLSLTVPEGLYPDQLRISADGRTIAYSAAERPGSREAGTRLLVRDLGSDDTRTVPGSEGVQWFTFSPDGQWIAFVAPIAPQSSRLRIFKAPVAGQAPPLALGDWDPSWSNWIVWLPDGDLLALTGARPQQIVRVPEGGGAPTAGTSVAPDVPGMLNVVSVLPDGAVLAELDTWDGRYRVDPAVLDPRTGAVKRLATDGTQPAISPTGHLVFARHGDLLAAPFDSRSHELRSAPVSIASGLRSNLYSYRASLALAQNGTLAHLAGGEVGGKRKLVLIGPAGVRPWSTDERRIPDSRRIHTSADGRWLALTLMNEDGLFEIWGSEMERPSLRRLGSFPTMDCSSPAWSADARLLAFECSGASETDGIHVVRMGATAAPERVLARVAGGPDLSPLSVTPDGSALLVRQGEGSDSVVLAVPLDGGAARGTPRVLLPNAGTIRDAELSRNGSMLAYVSQESGRFEVFVRRHANDGALGPPTPVATGLTAQWAMGPDGRESLLCRTESSQVVRIVVHDDLTVSAPKVLLDFSDLEPQIITSVVLRDGTLLAVLRGADERPPQSIRVVLGFTSELAARLR